MILRHFILRPNELAELSRFMARMNGKSEEKLPDGTVVPGVPAVHKRLRDAFASTLDSFLNAEDVEKTEAFGKNPARFLRQSDVTGADMRSVVYLYDFVTTAFRSHLRDDYAVRRGNAQEEAERSEILGLIAGLVKMREKEMRTVPNPLAGLISNSFILDSGEGMPDQVFDTYVGYRRSTEKGDIIRFVLRIERAGLRRAIQFENRYKRNGDTWYVDGVGYVVQGTLYLIGHCTNHNDVSRGLRMMALHRDPKSSNLFGLLISRDRKEPISARIFLVPAEDHRIGIYKANFEKLADRVLERDPHETYKHMIDRIRRELPADLDSNDSDLFRYICNANFSTLKCDPERDGDLIDLELRFRNHFVNHWGFDTVQMRAAYVQMLEKAVTEFEGTKSDRQGNKTEAEPELR